MFHGAPPPLLDPMPPLEGHRLGWRIRYMLGELDRLDGRFADSSFALGFQLHLVNCLAEHVWGPPPREEYGPPSRRIKQLHAYIEEHLYNPITETSAARAPSGTTATRCSTCLLGHWLKRCG